MGAGTDKASLIIAIKADFAREHKDLKNAVGLSRSIHRINSSIMARHGWCYSSKWEGDLFNEISCDVLRKENNG